MPDTAGIDDAGNLWSVLVTHIDQCGCVLINRTEHYTFKDNMKVCFNEPPMSICF